MTLARAGAFVLPVRILLMSSSLTPAPVIRHPLSVSSACHNGPVSDIEVVSDDDVDAGSALDAAFRKERKQLLHYLGRKAGADQAPDLVQEVFARAAGSRQAGVLANPAAFLTRIARNLLIDRARRRQANNVIMFPLDEARDQVVPPEQDMAIQASDLQRSYEQAIDRLPEKTRRVFLMSRAENLTYRQISEELGITVATVEYHMMRAIAFVATAMEAHR
jgi:RNA polymerase sigma factor (sigma-70 family)